MSILRFLFVLFLEIYLFLEKSLLSSAQEVWGPLLVIFCQPCWWFNVRGQEYELFSEPPDHSWGSPGVYPMILGDLLVSSIESLYTLTPVLSLVLQIAFLCCSFCFQVCPPSQLCCGLTFSVKSHQTNIPQ